MPTTIKMTKPALAQPKLSAKLNGRLHQIFADNSRLVTLDGVPIEIWAA